MASSRPSSPTPSCSSSASSVFPSSSKFSGLPVMALKDKIVEKILENRVTLIVGETGCGKSSQVPQFLVEKNMGPILCTQPRRFAVLAVARMVAKARNCELGEEVGYHIGHSKLLSPRSKIVFKTAGVLLDEMRDKGPNALKYKVIILDEVHERSVESDLVLVCLKQFLLKKNDLRMVLMSATADIGKYKDYFSDLGRGERVEVLAIPSCDQQTVFQRRVTYLEEVAELLGQSKESLSLRHCFGTSPSTTDVEIKPQMHQLIHDLVLHIHENEPDVEKSILVFLPTYYALEQQWHHLKPFSSLFKVHILHRSIDTEQALMAMKIWKSRRKVILATNIAESSVTIPKVAFVIDSCRSLQIFWDAARKKDSPELVWVSKSQADQRKGRTGRTCDGHVYRMVPSSFFSQLAEYECPAILKLSLRLQVLQIFCAESRSINDPKALLQKALSVPDPEVVEDALSLLVHMKALEKPSPRGRYEPTLYGRLLGSFTLSFDASMTVLKFGEAGLLREGIVLGILMDTLPLPIYQPFADEFLQTEYRHHFFSFDKNTVLTGRKEVDLLANLCAFEFWERAFKDKHRLEHLKQLLLFDDFKTNKTLLANIEEEWCSFHNLMRSSLLHVSEIYEEILNSLHRFRPKFLSIASGLPTYYHPYEFDHICLLQCQSQESNGIRPFDEQVEKDSKTMKCSAVPFVGSGQFEINIVAAQLANIIKEIRVQLAAEMSSGHSLIVGNDSSSHFSVDNSVCVFYLKGFCSRGSLCRFSHSLGEKRPSCRFFFSLQGCRYGQACSFSHELSHSVSSYPTGCFPEDSAPDNKFLQLLPTSSDGCVLLLDDTDMHFSSSLSQHYDPKRIISTTCLQETYMNIPSLTGVRIMWGLHHPYETIISKAGENPIPWDEIKLILWSPDLDGYSKNLDQQIILVRSFFEYMAIRILGDTLYDMRVVFTVNNIKFSQLQAEKLGRDSFFFLTESFPYDETSFGELSGNVTVNKPMVASMAISYVFDLHPPSDMQFGDYAAVIRKQLYSV